MGASLKKVNKLLNDYEAGRETSLMKIVYEAHLLGLDDSSTSAKMRCRLDHQTEGTLLEIRDGHATVLVEGYEASNVLPASFIKDLWMEEVDPLAR